MWKALTQTLSVVPLSAGIGRTGTFIVIDILIDVIREKGERMQIKAGGHLQLSINLRKHFIFMKCCSDGGFIVFTNTQAAASAARQSVFVLIWDWMSFNVSSVLPLCDGTGAFFFLMFYAL